MTSKLRVRSLTSHIVGRLRSPKSWAAGLAAILFAMALFAPAPAAAQQSQSDADWVPLMGKARPPSQTAINDCSQWATSTAGFNPGSAKLPTSWGQHKPPAKSGQAQYNRMMGACLGQRESPTN